MQRVFEKICSRVFYTSEIRNNQKLLATRKAVKENALTDKIKGASHI